MTANGVDTRHRFSVQLNEGDDGRDDKQPR
jgi:hypothetical protein